MKIAIYIEDGLEQIVLTPQSKTEESLLGRLHDQSREFELKRGSFYECRGGWTRFAPWERGGMFTGDGDDQSTIIVLRKKQRVEVDPEPEPEPKAEYGIDTP